MLRIQAAVGLLLAFACLSAARAESPAAAPPAAPTPAASGPLSVETFYAKAALHDAELSPSGRYVAALIRRSDGQAVLVRDLQSGQSSLASVSTDKDLDYDWVVWKGDDRLVLGVTLSKVEHWGGKADADISKRKYSLALMAVDREGGHEVMLFRDDPHTWGRMNHRYFMRLQDRLRGDPDHVLALAQDISGRDALWKADIHTGAAEIVEPSAPNIIGWVTNGEGAVIGRYSAGWNGNIISARGPGGDKWVEVARIHPKDVDGELADFEILGPSSDPAAMYVAVKPKDPGDGSARAVRLYDFHSRTLGPPLIRDAGYDVTRILYKGGSLEMAAACYQVDTLVCSFKDPHGQAVFNAMSRYFHGERNIEPVSYSDDGHWWLLRVSGPDDPGEFVLYDDQKHSVATLGAVRPDLPAERLGHMERFVFKARDGIQVPGYLTVPPGAAAAGAKAPLPMVLLPHGGPEARDDYDYDTIVQFLATRGYAVLQVNFRGSAGYGVAWADAGHRQWNGRMQDDLDDAVAAAIATGRIDRARICAMGISYGGYAALMAGARHPELYKCVVSWAGISDLIRSLKWEKNESGWEQEHSRYGHWVTLMGDPDKDHDALVKASPVTYAAKYGPPVLLLHGMDDDIVDPDQSQVMESALKKAGKDVRLISTPYEGHPAWSDEHMRAALTEIATFLKAHIAPAS
ncbi:alpha/beta hydrolase family protein [Caulobacter sp. KR2-114]|uniref:alpha/beta hydrolase family protein n=1 Tax=Caulobacter sp. KR2-114 TaxID=3400912 RepID=UPI003C094F40